MKCFYINKKKIFILAKFKKFYKKKNIIIKYVVLYIYKKNRVIKQKSKIIIILKNS